MTESTAGSTRFELFAHGADVGVRGIGPDPAAAFEQAAIALTATFTDPAAVRAEAPVEIACRAPRRDLLLVDWLNALIYEMATRRMVFGRFAVRLDDHALAAVAWGEPISPERHRPSVEPKGATYTELAVRAQADGSWLAQCVVDV